MNTGGSKPKFGVRTFHDDLRRAGKDNTPVKTAAEKPQGHAPLPPKPATPQTPSVPDTKPIKTPVPPVNHQPKTAADPFVKKTSTLRDTAKDIDLDEAETFGEGTIVKETKRKRWSLGKAIGQSLTNWAEEKKNSFEKALEKKEPTQPVVAPSEARKEVIEKAGAQSHIAPQDDHGVVIKKLRTLAKDAEEVTGQPFTVKKPATDQAPKWESARETPKPVPPPKEPQRPRPSIPVTPPTHIASEVLPSTAPPSRDIAFETPSFEDKKATNVRTLRNDAIDRVSEKNLSVPNIAAAEARKRTDTKPPKALPLLARVPLTQVMVGLVILSIVGGGSYLAFHFFAPQEMRIATTEPVFTFFDQVRQEPVTATESVEALLEVLAAKQNVVGGVAGTVIQYYPAIETENGLTPLTGTEFMALVAPRAPGSFVRGINEKMMYGIYASERRSPFLIVTVDTFDTAFAGMIGWEGNMVEDLAPIFGTETEGIFTDDVIENTDVRVLYNRLGDTQVVYGFINQHVLLMTATMPAFGTLMRQLRARGL